MGGGPAPTLLLVVTATHSRRRVIGRVAFLAITLIGIAIWLYRPQRKERLEAPARRMLEDDE